MSSSSSKPAILIIHGGYFLPSGWETFKSTLEASGYTVSVPRLPSCGDSRPPSATLDSDVSAAQGALAELVAAGHQVLVLAHSYGGCVASNALTPEFYHPHDSTSASAGGVVALVLLAAWLVQPGGTLPGVIDRHGFQSRVELGQNDDGTVWAKNAEASFYNDIEPARAAALAAANNVTHNWLAAMGTVVHAPWKEIPTTYVYTTQDLAIMLPLQRSMVDEAKAALEEDGAGVQIVEETMESAHCPFLSRPEEFLAVLERAAARIKA